MSMATLVGGFRSTVRLSRWNRVAYIVAAVSVACGLALAGKDSFLKSFEAFILLLLAVFTPWSAINLVDYYCFTRSRYDVPALTDPNGRYGRWNVRGIVVYLIGILVQIPFLATGLYTGPCVAALGGADISWILGLIVPSLIYYAVARRSGREIPAQLILPKEAVAAGGPDR
jgi:NCS1 family nucleobase:cation symporter-1